MAAAPLLTVSFKTTPVGALYAPSNAVAIWIQGPNGTFIKTIGRWAQVRKDHLVAWVNKATLNDVDAVSGATRLDHGAALSVTWDLKDKLGALVPDGTYTIRMETADGNSTASGQNHQGTFTFIKGLQPQSQPNLTNGGHVEVTIEFNPIANECNNGVLDPGETCDPPGSCPTSCDQAVVPDTCATNVVVGDAATCTSACMITSITACISDDACCPEGCTPLDDTDCMSGPGPTGARDGDPIVGGCATGDGDTRSGLLAFALFAALALVTRRRR